MSWIKFRTKLKDDGRVLIVSRKCHEKPVTVIGALITLWTYADTHADENGVLYGWTSEDVNRRVDVENFAESLPPEWIDLSGEWVQLPNYAQHNGTTGKTRAEDQKRKKLSRKRPDKTVTREEKIREEKSNKKENIKENIKEKSLTPVCDLWEGCEFFRMTPDEFQRVFLWYQKNNLPDVLVDLAIVEVDRWLAGDSPKARTQRNKTTSHYRQLMASWVIENAQKIAKVGGRVSSGKPSNVDIAIQEMKKYGGRK